MVAKGQKLWGESISKNCPSRNKYVSETDSVNRILEYYARKGSKST